MDQTRSRRRGWAVGGRLSTVAAAHAAFARRAVGYSSLLDANGCAVVWGGKRCRMLVGATLFGNPSLAWSGRQ
ncbi:MAG: hypothetical protein M0Z50_12850 [Planctomycetia bacterium]|nr:hypothetical protein [Planctomycetia bacterium]